MYLGIDEMAAMIREASPGAQVVGLADSGFFPDYDSPHLLTKSLKSVDGKVTYKDSKISYGTDMRGVSELMNISAGANTDCVQAFRRQDGERTRCIFAEHLIPFIKTPVFSTQVLCYFKPYLST